MGLVTAFRATGTTGTISATTTSARVALGSFGDRRTRHVRIVNGGANAVYIAFGSSAVTATSSDPLMLAGSTEIWGVPSDATHVAAITGSATSTVSVTPGEGV